MLEKALQPTTMMIFGSRTYDYDILGRRIGTTSYNEYGTIEEKLNTVFDDDNFKTYDYRSDSLLTLSALREVLYTVVAPYISLF